MGRRFAAFLALAALAAASATSSAQNAAMDALGADSSLLKPDSLPAAEAAPAVPRYLFSPVFTNKIFGDVSSIGMSNEFATGFTTPWGSTFNFGLSDEERNYRLTPQFEEKKILRLSDVHMFDLFWFGTASYSDSRVLNRSKTVGGGFTDFIINDQVASLGTNYFRKFTKTRADLTGSAGLIQSERTFKNDQGIQSGVNGGVAYNVGDRVVVQGRGALRGTWDESSTVDSLFTGLGSNEDSLATGLGIQFADSLRFDAGYKQYDGDRTFADQGRGSLGAQIGGAENVFEETEKRSTRNTTLSLSSRIAGRFGVTLSAMHDEQVLDYTTQDTRDSKIVGDGVTGSVDYRMPWRTKASVQFENSETLRDYGPLSNASLTDRKKRVALRLEHQFTKTFNMVFNGSSQIQQSFYLKYAENPRDRDQVDGSLNLAITSSPFKKVSAGIGLAYNISEFVNIDSLQSSQNRTRELWELRPSFIYHANERFSIQQIYGLAFEYTDYTFDENRNLLDRNITFTNTFRYKPMHDVDLLFEYSLYLHDNGSYLPDAVTGERLYEKAAEDRRDRTRIRIDYEVFHRVVESRVAGELTFFGEHQYSRLEEWTPGNFEARDRTTDGQIKVGSAANYDWGGGKILKFSVARVKRFSPFGSEKEKNFWDARSEIAYPF